MIVDYIIISLTRQGKQQHIGIQSSTAKQNTVEMMDYIAEIQMWAAEYLNITIPDPGEQLEFF